MSRLNLPPGVAAAVDTNQAENEVFGALGA